MYESVPTSILNGSSLLLYTLNRDGRSHTKCIYYLTTEVKQERERPDSCVVYSPSSSSPSRDGRSLSFHFCIIIIPVSLGVRPERRKKWTVNTTVSKEEKGRTTNTILEFN